MAVRVSDEIECPECGGTGEERLGSLRLLCALCQGRKQVGGNTEPPDDEPRAVWEHPAVRSSGLCPHCLGAGVVVAGGNYAEAPCPVCSVRDR
ncbi:hypothetical protein [Actinomadura spongiicola]|uniref:hypothetical protein n=1 Tax=Actinomadura spongiicola TaxID=2303421 RepID=UPI0011C1599E|nr:hypothetical protein [Actinomadura spongiicola]